MRDSLYPVYMRSSAACRRAELREPPRSRDEVRACCRDRRVENVFLKPVTGARGRGVLSLGRQLRADRWQRFPSGVITMEELLHHLFPEDGGTSFVMDQESLPGNRTIRAATERV